MLDASVVLALFDPHDALANRARRALARMPSDSDYALPASAYAEVLVGVIRRNELAERRAQVESTMRVVALDTDIAIEAARLRAQPRPLKLPDALVVATGEVLGATVLTGDRTWRRHSERVQVV